MRVAGLQGYMWASRCLGAWGLWGEGTQGSLPEALRVLGLGFRV